MKVLRKIAAVMTASSLLVSCASTTLIKTETKDVKVYADGNYLGSSPAYYTDTKIIGSTTNIMLKKEGCQPQTFTISRSEEFQVGACVGGALVLVPFLWVMGYKPERTLPFECEKAK